jgi:hypothetical protein
MGLGKKGRTCACLKEAIALGSTPDGGCGMGSPDPPSGASVPMRPPSAPPCTAPSAVDAAASTWVGCFASHIRRPASSDLTRSVSSASGLGPTRAAARVEDEEEEAITPSGRRFCCPAPSIWPGSWLEAARRLAPPSRMLRRVLRGAETDRIARRLFLHPILWTLRSAPGR